MNARQVLKGTKFIFIAFGVFVGLAAQGLPERLEGNYRLYMPEGEGPHPAVLMIPGCSGVSLDSPMTDRGGGSPTDPVFRRHYPRMAERLKGEGYVVLLLDYLTAENVINACSGEVPPNKIAEYIHSAVTLIKSLEFVDPFEVYIIGWSLGGAGVLAALERVPDGSIPFRSAVVFYPGCESINAWTTSIPVLLLLGGSDDITSPEPCKELASALPNGEFVEIHEYVDARHGFDVEEASCVMSTGRGTTIEFNQAAAKEAWNKALEFLKKHSD